VVNLSSFILLHAARTPDRPAVSYQGETASYSAFAERVTRLAGWLEAQGVGEDVVVAALMKNSMAFLELAFAVSHVGGVFLPINFRLAGDEVSYIVENAGAKLIFVDDALRENAGGNARAIVLDEAQQRTTAAMTAGSPKAPARVRKPSDMFRLMYTSGTTDRPKGVTHTYDNFYWKSWDHIATLGLGPQSRLLVVGPLYHVGAFDLPGVAALMMGGMLSVHRDFDAASVLKAIEAEKLDGAWLAPVMTTQLLSCPERDKYDVSSLRWAIGGGERTPEMRIRAFTELFRSARYIDAYGLTESCSGDTMMEAGRELEKIGSTGRALGHVEIEIRDESGAPLPPGSTGEICLRGPKVTRGYWRDPSRTAVSFYDEWFRTGDVGYLDDEGFLYLTDRLKDMIISGGENIASSEVERVILELASVREVAVIGQADEKWGEVPVAYVALEPEASLDFEALSRHCRAKLASFKTPKALYLKEALPRNPSGKILKRLLRASE
jgi:fatty-acyl-CoA synthase